MNNSFGYTSVGYPPSSRLNTSISGFKNPSQNQTITSNNDALPLVEISSIESTKTPVISHSTSTKSRFDTGGKSRFDTDQKRSHPIEQIQAITTSVSGTFQTLQGTKSPSSTLIENSMSKGCVLSPQRDRETLKKMQEIVKTTTEEMIKARKQIDQVILKYKEETEKANAMVATCYLNIMERIVKNDSTVGKQDAENAEFLNKLAEDLSNRLFNGAKQLMTLQDLNKQGQLSAYEGVIQLAFSARFKEIELLQTQLKLVHAQDHHQLTMSIQIRNQMLKEEEQLLEEYLKISEFESEEKQKAFEREMEERKQVHTELVNKTNLNLKEKEVDQAHSLEQHTLGLKEKEMKLKMEFDCETLTVSHEENKIKIDSETRLSLLKATYEEEIAKKTLEAQVSIANRAAATEILKTTIGTAGKIAETATVRPICIIQ